MKEQALRVYDKNYKKFLAFSLLLLFASLAIIGFQYFTTGEIVKKGVKLKGGLSITIPSDDSVSTADLQTYLKDQFPDVDIIVRDIRNPGQQPSLIIESSEDREADIIQAVRDYGISAPDGSYNTDFIDSSLGNSFYQQTIIAIGIAFLLMGVAVYITFRELVPSLFVMLAAFSDIMSTLAVVSVLGIRLSTAGIAGFLMLIGYSVDTDILLTTRVLRNKEGSIFHRIRSALRTGLVMSATSLAAVVIAYIFTQSDTIKQIMLILAVGLTFDLIYTWFQNAGILRWSLERKHKPARKEHHDAQEAQAERAAQ